MNIQKGNKGKIHKVSSSRRVSHEVGTSYDTVCNITVLLDDGYVTVSDEVTCKKCLKVLGELIVFEEKKEGTIFFVDADGDIEEFGDLQELYDYLIEEQDFNAEDIITSLEHENIHIIRGFLVPVKLKTEVKEEIIGLEEV